MLLARRRSWPKVTGSEWDICSINGKGRSESEDRSISLNREGR